MDERVGDVVNHIMQNDSVILALQEQVACYKRLAKLAEIQHEHVQNSQTDKLLEVLGKRQEVLEQVGRLEQVIGPVKRKWNEYLQTLAGAQRSSAETLLAQTRQLLEQITSADRNDAIVLQQRKLNLGRQIQKNSAARTVNRKYAASAYGPKASSVDIQH
jgi:hypothetical protein